MMPSFFFFKHINSNFWNLPVLLWGIWCFYLLDEHWSQLEKCDTEPDRIKTRSSARWCVPLGEECREFRNPFYMELWFKLWSFSSLSSRSPNRCSTFLWPTPWQPNNVMCEDTTTGCQASTWQPIDRPRNESMSAPGINREKAPPPTHPHSSPLLSPFSLHSLVGCLHIAVSEMGILW